MQVNPNDIRKQIARAGLRDRSFFRLHPGEPIYLQCPNGDGERFACIFRAVWPRIPVRARRSSLGHWRDPVHSFQLFNPTIELLEDWSSRVAGGGLRGDKAMVSGGGHKLRF